LKNEDHYRKSYRLLQSRKTAESILYRWVNNKEVSYSFFGRFPGLWILYADVSEHSVCSIFIGGVSRKKYLHSLWRWNRRSVPKRRHIKLRRRGITHKKEYNIQNTEKVSNQE